MTPTTPPLVTWLGTLSDLARLRLLRLLEQEELSVGEMAGALQLPQSTVSRHLKVLLEGGWVRKRVDGTASFYRLLPASLDPGAGRLWELARAQLGTTPTFEEDDHRLADVLARRRTDSRSFFGRVGGEWDHLRGELFGTGFTAQALLSAIPPHWVVADLGCGTGNAGEHLAPLVERIIAVDREPAMLERARQRLSAAPNVDFRQGDLAALPLADGEVDAAITVLVLHHLEAPAAAVAEMARALRGGGLALVVDMVRHDREAYRHTMGHRHLGFTEPEVEAWAAGAGLRFQRYRRLRTDPAAKGPGLFVATMLKRVSSE